MTALAWLLWTTLAAAESPGTLPAGSRVIYAGGGYSSFSSLDQGGTEVQRDRGQSFRADLYGSAGLTERFQLSGSVPLVYSQVADDPALLPCPGLLESEGYCDTYFTVGQARLDGRMAITQNRIKLTGGLAAEVDAWNQSRRGQYNSAGSGRSMLEAFAVAGGGVPVGKWRLRGLALGGFGYALAPDVVSADGETTVKALGDRLRGSVELRAKTPGPVALEVGVHGLRRLSGVDLDAAWVQDWFTSSQDRWNVLAYRQLAGSAKVSIDLPHSQGLHIGGSRVLSVENGPTDLFDVSVGWHRYFAP